MLETYEDIEYQPTSEIKSYKGSYPNNQLNKVRRYIINRFKREINSELEFEIKRKCAIFTKDMLNYKLLEKKPEEFDELKIFHVDPQQNPLVDKILDIDEEDLISNQGNHSIVNINSKNLCLPEPVQIIKDIINPEDDDIQFLNKDLLLKHGCDKWCSRNLSSINEINDIDRENLIYICDFCHFDSDNETIIREHLVEKKHGSASEFLREAKSAAHASNGLTSKPYDEYLKSMFDSDRKINFVKNRCCIRNKIIDEINHFEVLCPKCFFHFGHKILAACLHFKTCHSPTMNDEVYSIGEFIRTESFEIKKLHSCVKCGVNFKKLSDLAKHLKNSEHFPGSRKNEINILICPFDDCGYKSADFFEFKNHIMRHPFFNNSTIGKLASIQVKVLIYLSPKVYFHMPKNTEITNNDKKNELEAINDLIELNYIDDSRNHTMLQKRNTLKKYITDNSV